MIDLHAHIIPGIDDGAQSSADALEMAETAADCGVRILTATAHMNLDACDPEVHLAKYREGLSALRAGIAKAGIRLRVASGMELLVNDRLLRYAEEHPLPSLNGSGCLLAEFYFDVRYSYAERMLSALQEKGYRIVLAHPERYAFIRQDPERARELADNGVILQLNKGSFFREFGERSYHAARWILSRGLTGVIASDAHDPVMRTTDLAEMKELLETEYGPDTAELLLVKRPGAILRGK